MDAIRTEGLVKIFGAFQALNELSLTVEPGIVFGFLGPNGAGKTTTIRILTGLAHATHGKAWVAGAEVTADGRDIARKIGYLPEEPSFYPWLNPREYLDHVGRIFGIPADERTARIKELLGLVGLSDSAKRRIGGFSRGMRQRMGLAQALMNRPQVLFLDEPVSALDPGGRKEILEFIENLRGQCTVFMSTHILADVERICNTVGIINKGRLITAAPRQALLDQYVIPAFEMVVDPASADLVSGWTASIQREKWVKSIKTDGLSIHLVVNDLETAKRQLLPSIAHVGLVLEHYEIVHPSLEDVFLKLINQEGKIQ